LERENEGLKQRLAREQEENAKMTRQIDELLKTSSKAQKGDESNENSKKNPIPMTDDQLALLAPELSLKYGIIRVMEGDQDHGEQLLIDLIVQKVLTKYKEDLVTLFCNSVPLPSFVLYRCFMNHNKKIDEKILKYFVHSVNKLTKVMHNNIM
jgi:hypothetical protein